MKPSRHAEAIATWAEQRTVPALPQRSVGQPPKFPDLDAFVAAIDDYFDTQLARQRPLTMAGLARALGCSRQTIINYEHRDPRYMDAIKQARARVEEHVEEESLSREKQVAGHIFNLKNNFGWRDTQEIEHTHTLVMLGTGEQPLLPPAIDVTPLSPALDSAIPLSPQSEIALSDAQLEAKGPPIEGVSPPNVA